KPQVQKARLRKLKLNCSKHLQPTDGLKNFSSYCIAFLARLKRYVQYLWLKAVVVLGALLAIANLALPSSTRASMPLNSQNAGTKAKIGAQAPTPGMATSLATHADLHASYLGTIHAAAAHRALCAAYRVIGDDNGKAQDPNVAYELFTNALARFRSDPDGIADEESASNVLADVGMAIDFTSCGGHRSADDGNATLAGTKTTE
ncbi:MAG TPA: hypothetical protein VJ728_05715, partial [Candidatus Binataceae bacterium]|nr:hypothetical protein [Candidatus Binataceae bacterium]